MANSHNYWSPYRSCLKEVEGIFFLRLLHVVHVHVVQERAKSNAYPVQSRKVVTVSDREQGATGTWHSSPAGHPLLSPSQLLPWEKVGLRMSFFVKSHTFNNHSLLKTFYMPKKIYLRDKCGLWAASMHPLSWSLEAIWWEFEYYQL